jgi:prepilin-type processing-associated H-X9-DG protein
MAFKDQIQYFKNAKLVIGIHGGGLANILFCRPKTILLEVSGGGDFGWHFLNNSCKTLSINQIKCENDLNEIKNILNNITI